MTEVYLNTLRALLADLENQIAEERVAAKLLEDQRFVTSVLIYLLEKNTPTSD